MDNKILIIGGSGFVGGKLAVSLTEMGYEVRCLGQNRKIKSSSYYLWDISNRYFDELAFKDVGIIINLAGAGVANKRWSVRRKSEIRSSRIESTKFLKEILSHITHEVHTVISASAIGYYGDSRDGLMSENRPPGTDFLAGVVSDWEAQINQLRVLNIRVVVLRIGVVLSNGGGALEKLVLPIRWGVGSVLGSGNQFVSWIHITDLCNIFVFILLNRNLEGVYNAVAPTSSTNREMTRLIATVLGMPLWLPPIPSVVLRLALGQMSEMIVGGCKVSANKIQKCGYVFCYPDLKGALMNLLGE